jgi:hypothetical protein
MKSLHVGESYAGCAQTNNIHRFGQGNRYYRIMAQDLFTTPQIYYINRVLAHGSKIFYIIFKVMESTLTAQSRADDSCHSVFIRRELLKADFAHAPAGHYFGGFFLLLPKPP